MPKKKNIPIKYTSRDFEAIKEDLVDHARRYYSDTYKDFSVASFGSLVLDSVAYVGDVLSFYLDYQANESFLDTAIEYANVRRHAKNYGYRYTNNTNSYGTVALFVIVPANSGGTAPDFSYIPVLKLGATFGASDGATYVLTEDVDFSDPANDVVAARFDSSSGQTTHFAIRGYGQVISGALGRKTIDLSAEPFQRFRRIQIGGTDITDIISVIDNDGNIYYEVENLTQEVIFVETTNPSAASDGVRSILKPVVAARRYVMEQDESGTYLQFGDGSESDDQLTGLWDPSRVATKMHGKRNIATSTFDPTHMVKSGKLGISPSGKTLTVVIRTNSLNRGNSAPPNTVNSIISREFHFNDTTTLSGATKQTVRSSLEVSNPEAIIGSNQELTKREIKLRAKAHYAAQGRAVTAQDYESLVYGMPQSLGAVKRCAVVNDPSSASRRLSLYVVSSHSDGGSLVPTIPVIKNNIKNHLSRYRSLNDVIDVHDAKIVNFGIEFVAITSPTYNSNDIMNHAVTKIEEHFQDQMFIGEPLYLSRLYGVLNKISGIVDVKKVTIVNRTDGVYSSNYLDFDDLLSRDGTYYNIPKNVILELKYPTLDIKGTVK